MMVSPPWSTSVTSRRSPNNVASHLLDRQMVLSILTRRSQVMVLTTVDYLIDRSHSLLRGGRTGEYLRRSDRIKEMDADATARVRRAVWRVLSARAARPVARGLAPRHVPPCAPEPDQNGKYHPKIIQHLRWWEYTRRFLREWLGLQVTPDYLFDSLIGDNKDGSWARSMSGRSNAGMFGPQARARSCSTGGSTLASFLSRVNADSIIYQGMTRPILIFSFSVHRSRQ